MGEKELLPLGHNNLCWLDFPLLIPFYLLVSKVGRSSDGDGGDEGGESEEVVKVTVMTETAITMMRVMMMMMMMTTTMTMTMMMITFTSRCAYLSKIAP